MGFPLPPSHLLLQVSTLQLEAELNKKALPHLGDNPSLAAYLMPSLYKDKITVNVKYGDNLLEVGDCLSLAAYPVQSLHRDKMTVNVKYSQIATSAL